MNEKLAAREIEKAYRSIVKDSGNEVVSLWNIWNAIIMFDMTREELYAGAKYLARTTENTLLSPILYPWQYSQAEKGCGPVYGGQHCQTLIIQD